MIVGSTYARRGFRDVHWCSRLNEPVILEYRGDPRAAFCTGCQCEDHGDPDEFGTSEGFLGDHPFIIHILKPLGSGSL